MNLENKWYLYRHIRLDKNEPFYIGIGCKANYRRSNEKTCRNPHWKNIASKTDYKVNIMFDNLTFEQACEKEIEMIQLYGRLDDKNGTLVNMTSGGEGVKSYKKDKELLERQYNSYKKRLDNDCKVSCIDINLNFRNANDFVDFYKNITGENISLKLIINALNFNKKAKGLSFILNNKNDNKKRYENLMDFEKEKIKNYFLMKASEALKERGEKISKSKKENAHIISEQSKKRYLKNPESFKNSIMALEAHRVESKRLIKCINNGLVFKGLEDVHKWLLSININCKNAKGVWNACNGKAKSAYGFKWENVNDI
jgi:hypothetical protein